MTTISQKEGVGLTPVTAKPITLPAGWTTVSGATIMQKPGPGYTEVSGK